MRDEARNTEIPANWDRRGLPGWCYHSNALLELEKSELFKTHWQIACHVSDVPEPGNFLCFDMCGERALILKDSSSDIRAFLNVCRHRGSRLVSKEQGKCAKTALFFWHSISKVGVIEIGVVPIVRCFGRLHRHHAAKLSGIPDPLADMESNPLNATFRTCLLHIQRH